MPELLRRPWTVEELKEEALKYKTRIELAEGSYGAYQSAYRRGILNDICQHMIS